MRRIHVCFEQLKAQYHTALVPYITAGDPLPNLTVPLLHSLVKGGADMIELGMPFSDPMVDGPVIQRACERALNYHVTIDDVLTMVQAFRQTNTTTPIILMGYANPIEKMGYRLFAEKAKVAGVDAALVVDMPPEEADEWLAMMDNHDMDSIFLVSPTTSEARIAHIAKKARGFVYYVSIKGITGAANINLAEVEAKLTSLREHIALPLGVGFGIRDAESAARVACFADAVVIGSALVECIEKYQDEVDKLPSVLTQFLTNIRHAIDGRDINKIAT